MISLIGVMPIHTPAIWRLNIRPRVQVFIWLLNNKTALYSIKEGIWIAILVYFDDKLNLLFTFGFEYCVASNIWHVISHVLCIQVWC